MRREAQVPDETAPEISSASQSTEEPTTLKPIAPGLYLVGTPIGNLEDITLRALRVLRSVDRIACEDTRQTQKLLNHYGIRKPTISYHGHNEGTRSEELIADLRNGSRIALVSDAGLPGISDPGEALTFAALRAGVPVIPIPGANAALTALISSGLPAGSFTFHGFLPSKEGQRRSLLEQLRASMAADPDGPTHIFYEAPHRILPALEDIASIFGPSHPLVLARELTKLHEEFLRGAAADVLATLQARDAVRGEMVLLLAGEPVTHSVETAPSTTSLADDIASAIQSGLPEKDALKQIARVRGVSKSEAYREWQRRRRS